MGMPKTPKQLEEEIAVRNQAAAEPDYGPSVKVATADGPLPPAAALRNTLRGWHWQGYARVFQILEIVCPTDRAFERARKQVLDVANDQERTMAVIVNRMTSAPVEKEQGNGSETPNG